MGEGFVPAAGYSTSTATHWKRTASEKEKRAARLKLDAVSS